MNHPGGITRTEAAHCTRLQNLTRIKRQGGNCALVETSAAAGSYLPVPVRLEVCGLLFAPSLTLNIPVLVPVCVGVKTTLMLQCAAAATLVPQVVAETLKSPLAEIETLNATFRWLVKVNTFAGLLVPLARAG